MLRSGFLSSPCDFFFLFFSRFLENKICVYDMRDFRENGYCANKWQVYDLKFRIYCRNILCERKWKLHQKETESLALWSFTVHKWEREDDGDRGRWSWYLSSEDRSMIVSFVPTVLTLCLLFFWPARVKCRLYRCKYRSIIFYISSDSVSE